MTLNKTQKMAITGVGLMAAGIGLGVVGAALVTPAFLGWAADVMEKGTDRLAANAERTSKMVGTVAGTLQRSFSAAAKAGLMESRRGVSTKENGSV